MQSIGLLSFVFSLYISIVTSQATFVKGVRGSEVTLVCVSPNVASSIVSWTKIVPGLQMPIASSSQGVPHFSDPVQDRASFDGGNLTISSLLLSDEGNYTCSVFATQRAPMFLNTVLTVTGAPIVKTSVVSSPTIDSNMTYVPAICTAELAKPVATIRWLDRAGKVQNSRSQKIQNNDGSWNVTEELILTPGLLGKNPYSLPLLAIDTSRNFMCDVIHDDLDSASQKRREVIVDLLFPPVTHVSILGNRLTCHAVGNPPPSVKWSTPSGLVIENQTTLFLGQDSTYNGRYSCLATSSLKPDSISTLDVQKARDLPVLFRTLFTLNASLPVTASGYEILCSAEIADDQNSGDHSLEIEWTKNGQKITGNTYQTRTRSERVHSSRTRILSSLVFLDVERGRDDAIFQCRFTNSSRLTGFVTAVEKSVSISVDYPPFSLHVGSRPSDFQVVEGNTLTLSCLTDSKPVSTYQWYFKGKHVHTGKEFEIHDASRTDAGIYRCIAYNYVPGSAREDVMVTVHYRPSDVIITNLPENRLTCEAKGGGVPSAVYHWIYPNATRTWGNVSVITLLDPPSDGAHDYTCIASNGLGSANATYLQHPPIAMSIGAISLTEFIIVLVVSVVITLIAVGFIFWFYRRRRRFVGKANKMSAEEAFKQYLQFAEPPGAVKVGGKRKSSSDKPTSDASDNPSTCKNPQLTSHMEVTRAMSDFDNDPTDVDAVETTRNSSVGANDTNASQTRKQNSYQISEEEDGNKNPFPHPLSSDSANDDAGFGISRGVKALENRLHSQSTCSPRTTEEYVDNASESTFPSESRVSSTHTEGTGRIQTPAMIPFQYFHTGNPVYDARIPLQSLRQNNPVRVMAPGYEHRSAAWTSTNSHLGVNSPRHYTTSSFGQPLPVYPEYPLTEVPSVSSVAPDDNFSQNLNIRPRSMSLSASSSSCLSSNAFERNDADVTNSQQKYSAEDKSRTLSPFDSGNDSGRSGQVYYSAKKQPSLTLV